MMRKIFGAGRYFLYECTHQVERILKITDNPGMFKVESSLTVCFYMLVESYIMVPIILYQFHWEKSDWDLIQPQGYH